MTSTARRLVACAFAALAAAPADARAQAGPLGIFTGIGASALSEGPPATGLRPAFTFGVFYTPGWQTLSWQIEGLFQTKGGTIGTATDTSFRSYYFELPVMARLNFLSHHRTRVHLLGGASIGWKASAVIHTGETSADVTHTSGHSYDIAIVAAGGIELGNLVLQLRWSEGLIESGITFDGRSSRNRVITTIVGWRFGAR
jgi:hypothetical protein